MPYEITRLANKKFQVINSETGKIHAKQTTLKNAKKQLSLLERLEESEQPQMEGDGLLNIASSLWSPSTAEPPQIRKFLQDHGSEIITKMFVRREPLSFLINSVLMLFSFGEVYRKIRASPYDELYHLSLYIETNAGTKFIFQKNERININEKITQNEYIETLPVRIIKQITVNELFENTKKLMGDKFYPYNAIYNNCQNFVTNVLKANNLLVPIASQFINQNVAQIFNTTPSLVKKIMEYVIYASYATDVVISGGEIEENDLKI